MTDLTPEQAAYAKGLEDAARELSHIRADLYVALRALTGGDDRG